MSPKPNVGVLVPLVAKSEKISDVHGFLLQGLELVKAEPLTLHWFGIKYVSDDPTINSTFAVFDTFEAHEGRQAHVEGKVVGAVAAKAGELLSVPPAITDDVGINILASKVKPIAGASGPNAGLTKGLRVLIKAKEDKKDEIRDYLTKAVATIEKEPGTAVWYAIEYPGTNVFGIVDFFPDEAARETHIKGEVAKALFDTADEVLVSPPDVVYTDVVGAKL